MRTILTAKDFVQKPWRNLRGSTLEVLKYPTDSSDDFLFRLSRADLTESGPFSQFPGVDRILVVTEGAPIAFNGTALPLWKTISFRGEDPVHAGITEPGKDFNLMLRRGKASGSIQVESGKKVLRADADFFAVFTFHPLELQIVQGEPSAEITVDQKDHYLVIRVNLS